MAPVQSLRHLLKQRYLAMLICTAALLLKLLVPAGYMIDGASGQIAMCSGSATQVMTTRMPALFGAIPGQGLSKDHDKAEAPCVFAGLSTAMPDLPDPFPFTAPIVLGPIAGRIAAAVPTSLRPAYLRPPLRAPPTGL